MKGINGSILVIIGLFVLYLGASGKLASIVDALSGGSIGGGSGEPKKWSADWFEWKRQQKKAADDAAKATRDAAGQTRQRVEGGAQKLDSLLHVNPLTLPDLPSLVSP